MSGKEGGAWAGAAIAALGAGLAVMMVLRPQALRAPPLVGYLSAFAFVFAGLMVIARARRHRLLQAWLPVPMVGCLVAPAVWLGFGSGPRQCTLGGAQFVLSIFGIGSDLHCRIAFAIAAVLGLGILLLVLRHAIRGSRDGGAD